MSNQQKVSVQIQCEVHDHESIRLSSINSLKQENHQKQNYLIFKVYVCPIQAKVYIHIQTQRVHKDICMKARGSKRMYMYNNNLNKKDIYMKLNINTKT